MHPKIFESMIRHGIGVDAGFFEKTADAPNFPPHNIVQLEENRYLLTLAVAGFQSAELKIYVESDLLTVSGQKDAEQDKEGRRVLYRGIAFREFSRQFKIGENVHVQDASLNHGLLNITLVREIPEARRPKLIPITA
jgi:molecular chaperone IbpA